MKRKLLYSLIPMLFIVGFSFIGCGNDGIADKLTEAQIWNDRALESVDYLEELLDEQGISDNPDIIHTLEDVRAEISEVKFYLEILEEEYFGEEKY